ncbi:MAG: LysM peptidoglycan-binding domain-containing protein [Acidimicrobiia bacterium]|nr:LysM peptidoglycan-binding domain-containing protein [Acidimicrobiia bacterium]
MMRHLNSMIRGLVALIVVLGFVIGVPAGLIAYVGWPLPDSLPTLDQIQLGFRSGIDPQLLISVLAAIVWIVWAQLLIALTAEVVAAARGRAARRLPFIPGLQPAVAQLVAAITLATATLGPLHAVPATAAPLPIEMSVASSYPVVRIGQEPATPRWAKADSQQQTETELPRYLVTRHDTLWHIAESTLGDGRRWAEVRTLNAGRDMRDGHRFTETTERLHTGWELILPADATTAATEPPPPTADEVTVVAGDNFWTIAETTLAGAWGRPPSNAETAEYWRTLIDANRDRLAPPYDPDLIYPDQQFELPPIPADPKTQAVAPIPDHIPSSADGVVVEEGDSFWSIAQQALTNAWDRTPSSAETTSYWRRMVDLNRDRLSPPHDPNLIYPGQVFQLPAIPEYQQAQTEPDTELDTASPPETPPTAREETGTTPDNPTSDLPPATTPLPPKTDEPIPTDATGTTYEAPASADPADDTDEPDSVDDGSIAGELFPMASRLAGLGILAAGLATLLRRLRNAQLRHRRPGTVPTAPPPDTAKVESTIRSAAAPTATEFIDLALRSMARDVTESHIPPPQVVGVHLTADTLRVLLWAPHKDPPAGWAADDGGRSWTIPTVTDIDRLRTGSRGVPAPYPALVTAGHGDHAQLLLDLEYLGATQVTGEPTDVAATCYTMATELAATPLADDLQIICIGFGDEIADLERVTVVDHLTEVLPALEAKATAVTRLESQAPLAGRLSPGAGDTWNPIIILDPATDPPEEARQLLTLAHSGRGVAAVVGYPTGDRWRLHIKNDTVRIDPLGFTFARRNLTPVEQATLGDLVTAGKDLEGLPAELATDPLQHIVTDEDLGGRAEVATEPALFDEDHDIAVDGTPIPVPEMKVLGTLHVDGIDGRFPLRKCTELVAYLTFHRGGVEADTLMEALWPEQAPEYQRLNRHTSRTRTTLGIGPDGEPYVGYVSDGIYRLSSHLRSDIERFTGHIRQADQNERTNQTQHLYAALDLVEGTPFSGAGNAYNWAHTDGIITHAIVAIDNAAHRLAQHALQADDPDQATWAARKGLIATGACEECYRNLMRAAIAEGNQVAFEATYTELLAVTDADDGPDGASFLDPATIALYEQHNRSRRRHAG